MLDACLPVIWLPLTDCSNEILIWNFYLDLLAHMMTRLVDQQDGVPRTTVLIMVKDLACNAQAGCFLEVVITVSLVGVKAYLYNHGDG